MSKNNMSVIDSWTKEEFLEVMSDVYKDTFGVRPRGINYSEWSLEKLKEEFQNLLK